MEMLGYFQSTRSQMEAHVKYVLYVVLLVVFPAWTYGCLAQKEYLNALACIFIFLGVSLNALALAFNGLKMPVVTNDASYRAELKTARYHRPADENTRLIWLCDCIGKGKCSVGDICIDIGFCIAFIQVVRFLPHLLS